MLARETDGPEWRAGFIFVANQLCLDFLNTRLTQRIEPFEFLVDVRSVSRWLGAANLVSPARVREAGNRWSRRPGGKAFMTRLWAFREELREAVLAFEAGKKPQAAFIAELNRLLVEHPIRYELRMAGTHPNLRRRLDLEVPDDAYGPIVDAAASLFTGDSSRVRKCEACPGQFYDTSKKNARRWCSMRRCGNKVKVAAYTKRHAGGTTSLE